MNKDCLILDSSFVSSSRACHASLLLSCDPRPSWLKVLSCSWSYTKLQLSYFFQFLQHMVVGDALHAASSHPSKPSRCREGKRGCDAPSSISTSLLAFALLFACLPFSCEGLSIHFIFFLFLSIVLCLQASRWHTNKRLIVVVTAIINSPLLPFYNKLNE
jgi:hypothetical protein